MSALEDNQDIYGVDAFYPITNFIVRHEVSNVFRRWNRVSVVGLSGKLGKVPRHGASCEADCEAFPFLAISHFLPYGPQNPTMYFSEKIRVPLPPPEIPPIQRYMVPRTYLSLACQFRSVQWVEFYRQSAL